MANMKQENRRLLKLRREKVHILLIAQSSLSYTNLFSELLQEVKFFDDNEQSPTASPTH